MSAPLPPTPVLPTEAPIPEPTDEVGAIPSDVSWQLVVTPRTVTMGHRDSVRFRIVATNRGTTPANLADERLSFLLNGNPSMDLNMAFGNGGHDGMWMALPPGQHTSDERVGMVELSRDLMSTPSSCSLATRKWVGRS